MHTVKHEQIKRKKVVTRKYIHTSTKKSELKQKWASTNYVSAHARKNSQQKTSGAYSPKIAYTQASTSKANANQNDEHKVNAHRHASKYIPPKKNITCKHRTNNFPLPFCLLSFGMTGTEKIYPLGINQYFLGGMDGMGWMGWMEVRVRILLWPMYWTQNSRVISHNSVPFRLISHNSVIFRDEFQHFHDFWTIPNTSYHNYEALVTLHFKNKLFWE